PPPTPPLFPYTTLFRSHPSHGASSHRQQPLDAQMVDQFLLQANHVSDGDRRKRHAPRAARRWIDRARTRGPAASTEHVGADDVRSEEHTSELQSRSDLV